MFVGPVFHRELTTLPRRAKLYASRAAYVGGLAALWITAWQVLAGSQTVRNVGGFSMFGATVFQVLAPLYLTAAAFFAAFSTAAAVAHEKERRTFDLLLLTNLSNRELVLGKLGASLLGVFDFALAAVPLFTIAALCGGFDFRQIGALVAVTLCGAVAAGSLGSTVALWRERSFQTLATTTLTLVAWTGFWEAVAQGTFCPAIAGNHPEALAAAASPWHAALSCTRPFDDFRLALRGASVPAWQASLMVSALLTLALNALAVWRVRVWNPSRELVARGAESATAAAAEAPHAWTLNQLRNDWRSPTADAEKSGSEKGEPAVAARGLRRTRNVWDNPVLWRETMTWAYGRKVLFVRLFYASIFAAAAWSVYSAGEASRGAKFDYVAPAAVVAVLGVLLVNIQAVTSITSERDAKALDLLLVTDITPKEFVFGKLAGVLFNTKEMIALPLLLCGLLWQLNIATGEAATYLALGWLTLAGFAAVVGVHVGMQYGNSRQAAAVSFATIFFLVVGIAVSMRIMTAFSGSFQAQLQPFLATIGGGGIGLYAALGRRNPSAAITLGAFLLPLATFYALTSFLLGAALASLLAVLGAYGFTIAALLVPAVFEFDVATGRTSTGDDRE